MPHRKRQMHLAVFWLGTGNHIAGWRMDGAFDSNCSWPIAEAGARIAERGKFDLFFIADSLVSAPNDHPSYADAPRADDHRRSPESGGASHWVRLHCLDELQRAVQRRARVPVVGPPDQRAHCLEHRHLATRRTPTSTSAGRRHVEHDQRYEIARRVRRRGARAVARLGRRRGRARQEDGRLRRSHQGACARPQGSVFSGARAAQHGADRPRRAVADPSRWLGGRPGALGAHGRHRLLGRQRRQGRSEDRLRRAQGLAWPNTAASPTSWRCCRASCRSSAARKARPRPSSTYCRAGYRRPTPCASFPSVSATTSPAIRSTGRCRTCH